MLSQTTLVIYFYLFHSSLCGQENPSESPLKPLPANVSSTLPSLTISIPWPSGAILCDKDDVCLCNGNSSNVATSGCVGRNCFCDEFCEEYNDCCKDYVPDERPKYNDSLQREWIDDVMQCQIIPAINYNFINIITKCPTHYNDETMRQLCENEEKDELSEWPVTGKQSGFLYKNIYCSTCNEEFNVEFWVKNMTCNLQVFYEPTLGDQKNETEIKHYIENEQQNFAKNLTLVTEEKYCKREITYTSKLAVSTCEVKIERIPDPGIQRCATWWHNDTVRDLCEDGYTSYVENRIKDKYKNWYCAICNRNTTIEDDVNCHIFVPVVSHSSTRTEILLSPEIDLNTNGVVYRPISVLFDVTARKQSSHSVVGYEQSSFEVKTETVMKTCEDGYLALGNRCVFINCGKGYIFQNDKCTLMFENILKFPNENDEVEDKETCYTAKLNEDQYTIIDNGSLFLNYNKHIVDPLSYKNITENGTHFIEVCLPSEVFSKNYTIIQYRTIPIFTLKFANVLTMISFVGQIVSTVALFILFLVYAFCPTLRNVPGKCVMSLAVSLGLAQVLFLVGIGRLKPTDLCYAFSVLIHYMYLAAFFWMNVMAFDICRVFAGIQSQTSSDQSRKRFLYYCLYAWLSPAIIVLVAILVDQFVKLNPQSSDFYFVPRYGNGLCFIGSRDGLLLFFIIPVAILMFLNFIFYVLTARGIYLAMKVAMLVRKAKRNRCKLLVYLKLSLIMGLTWALGFLQAATDEHWISYVFVFLNTLQGLLICIVFLCTKKVFTIFSKTYRKSFKVKATKKSALTDQTTTTEQQSFLSANNTKSTQLMEVETSV